jgi:hypothetical protein
LFEDCLLRSFFCSWALRRHSDTIPSLRMSVLFLRFFSVSYSF